MLLWEDKCRLRDIVDMLGLPPPATTPPLLLMSVTAVFGPPFRRSMVTWLSRSVSLAWARAVFSPPALPRRWFWRFGRYMNQYRMNRRRRRRSIPPVMPPAILELGLGLGLGGFSELGLSCLVLLLVLLLLLI